MEDILVPTGKQPFRRLILTRAEENVTFCLWREAGPVYRQPMIAIDCQFIYPRVNRLNDIPGEVAARDNQTELNSAVTDRCAGGVYMYRRVSLLHGCLGHNIPDRPCEDFGNGKC
jgi:hypothetical protein